MADAKGQGQADKKAAEERTADVAQENEATSAAQKVLQVDASDAAVNPYPAYDFMTLEQLREVGKERDVELPRDVEKSLWITELRAKDTQA